MKPWNILLLLFILGCKASGNEKEPNLIATRKAPLGWVTLKTYPDKTFEFISSGIREEQVYPGTYLLKKDTLFFTYSDSIPKLNSFKAVITGKYIEYKGGTYGEGLEIKLNELKSEE